MCLRVCAYVYMRTCWFDSKNNASPHSSVRTGRERLEIYLSLMETKKSLGVEEKSSKLAMSSCLTWMGSQSSITNLEGTRASERKSVQWVKACPCPCQCTHQILLLQGFSMYRSMFSMRIAEVLWKQTEGWVCATDKFTHSFIIPVIYQYTNDADCSSTSWFIVRVSVRNQQGFNLGLVVGRQDLGATFHRGVVILEVFLDLLHWKGAAAAWSMKRLTWTKNKKKKRVGQWAH